MLAARSFVYVFQHATESVVKIGKSDRPALRALQLEEDIDLDRSFAIELDARLALKAEAMFHFIAHRFAVERERASGYTEWFTAEAVDAVRSFIERNDLRLRLNPIAVPALRLPRTTPVKDRFLVERAYPQPIGSESAVRAFLAAFDDLASCSIFRDENTYDANIYIHGEALTHAICKGIIELSEACDAPGARWMHSATFAESEMLLRISTPFAWRVCFEHDQTVASDVQDWYVRIPDLPRSGIWRARFDALETTLWNALLGEERSKASRADTSVGVASGEV
jgi:hypothetical protein